MNSASKNKPKWSFKIVSRTISHADIE